MNAVVAFFLTSFFLLVTINACSYTGAEEESDRLMAQAITFAQPGPFSSSVGDSFTNIATGGDGTGSISYNSADESIATVDAAGLVNVLAEGSVRITAEKSADPFYENAVASYVINATRMSQAISFSQAGPVSLFVGNTLTNVASGGAGSGVISYVSNNESAVTVNANGLVTVVGVGSATITATKAADIRYNQATATYTINTSKQSQTIEFSQAGPVSLFVGDTLSNVASGGGGSGTISYSSSDNAIATVDAAGLVTVVRAGNVTITAEKASDSRYFSATANYQITASRNAQTISFAQAGPVALFVGDTLSNVASGGAGTGTISYSSSDETVATVNGAGLVTVVSAGTATITAEKAADVTYAAATDTFVINTSRNSQTFAFAQPGPFDLLVGDTQTNVASGGAGSGSITYSSSDTSVATVDPNGLVSVVGPGTAIITADKAQDTVYAAATDSYTIHALIGQSIAFDQAGPFNLLVADTLINIASGGAGTGVIAYRSSDTAVASVDAVGLVTILGAGNVIITAEKAADATYAVATDTYIIDALIGQSIAFAQAGPVALFVGDALSNVASGGAGTGIISYSSSDETVATVDAAGLVTVVSAGTATITAEKAADVNYASAMAAYVINSSRNAQTISFAQPGPFDLLVGNTQTNVASGGAGSGSITYSSSDSSVATVDSNGVVSVVGPGTAIITADKAQDTVYAAATDSYTINALIPQSISFNQAGPFELLVGETLSNTASGGAGTGAITYSSSDSSIATVDAAGLMTVVGAGSVIITADKAADTNYAATNETYSVISIPTSIDIAAWVGNVDSEVVFPGSAAGVDFYRSRDENCDISNYTACTDGQLDIVAGSAITDTVLTETQGGYYVLEHGVHQVSFDAGNQLLTTRQNHALLTFDNRLWIIGGAGGSGNLNDVWSSRDGRVWTQQTAVAGFSARQNHQIVAFDNELWLIGGNDGSNNLNDVWSSADGITWTEQTPNANFSARQNHQVVVFGSELWLIGGNDGSNNLNDVWSSSDGITWTAEATPGFTARQNHQAVVFDNDIWVVGGNDGSNLNDVWLFDGSTWTQQTASAGFSTRSGHQVSVFGNAVWVFGDTDNSDAWSSTDGTNWTQQTTSSAYMRRDGYRVAVWNNQAWISGGDSGTSRLYPDVWSTSDGINWAQQTTRGNFSERAGYGVAEFDNQLWLVAGVHIDGLDNDVWSSSDGAKWTQKTADAAFSNRIWPQLVEFNNKLWMFGANNLNDIWSSSDGITWTQETAVSAFPARSEHQVVNFDNRLWVIGGSGSADVWSSTDGLTWIQETAAAAFSGRSRHQVVVFDNQMWLIGGNDGAFQDDVWSSSDGITWTLQTATPGFSGRQRFGAVAFDNKLWVIGGRDNSGRINDVWSSSDGINWTQVTASADFTGRSTMSAIVFNGFMYVIAGDDNIRRNDIWRSSDGITWREGFHGTFDF